MEKERIMKQKIINEIKKIVIECGKIIVNANYDELRKESLEIQKNASVASKGIEDYLKL